MVVRWQGQGSCGSGVDARLELGEEVAVGVLPLPAPVQGGRQQRPLRRIEFDPARDRVGAPVQGGPVACDPVRRHPAVGIGGEDHAGLAQPVGGPVHGLAPGPARMRAGIGHMADAHRHRHPGHEIGDDRLRGIGAVVEEQHHAEAAGGNAGLGVDGAQAGPDAFGLVAHGNRDDRAGRRQRAGRRRRGMRGMRPTRYELRPAGPGDRRRSDASLAGSATGTMAELPGTRASAMAPGCRGRVASLPTAR